MRNDLTYIGALQSIGSGFAQLGVCIYNTIMANKTLTLLIVSLVTNIMLTLALANERATRDCQSAQLYDLQVVNDSLRGAEVKYYHFHE